MLLDGFGDQTPVVSGLQSSGSIGCMIANKFPSVSLNHAALNLGHLQHWSAQDFAPHL
jgi:hypothetical protein